MTPRITAVGTFVVFLIVVGGFLSVSLMGPGDEPQSAAVGATPVVMTRDMGKLKLHAQITLADTGAYELSLSFVDEAGALSVTPTAPTVRVSMLGHDMGTASPPVQRAGPGTFRARGNLSTDGRWQFRVIMDGHEANLNINFSK